MRQGTNGKVLEKSVRQLLQTFLSVIAHVSLKTRNKLRNCHVSDKFLTIIVCLLSLSQLRRSFIFLNYYTVVFFRKVVYHCKPESADKHMRVIPTRFNCFVICIRHTRTHF